MASIGPTRRSSRRIGNSRKIGLRARLRTGKGMHDIQNHAAVTIQAHYRGWKARKLQESKRGRPGSVGLRAEMPPVVGDHRPREDTVMQNVLAALRKAATRVSDRMQSTGDDMGRDDAAWLADVNEKWAQFAELYASKACSARQHLTLAAETNGCLEVLKNALSQSPSAMEVTNLQLLENITIPEHLKTKVLQRHRQELQNTKKRWWQIDAEL
ncbi:hypothetical protein SeLEV6574_g01448 [Synchytrium endobioticum]|uniref:Uncharacterized protein n=1 Tax=Synchytrium endobioticum TaxID=286115 RepID=A0A507DD09_9FUNG|nr:hypothetical protein SeLEV6574_g01448 [Synchytrium endobioticum]